MNNMMLHSAECLSAKCRGAFEATEVIFTIMNIGITFDLIINIQCYITLSSSFDALME